MKKRKQTGSANSIDASQNHRSLREHIVSLLRGGSAHANFNDAVAGFPAELRGRRFAIRESESTLTQRRRTKAATNGFPYSAWELLEHLRIAQRDILGFSRSPKHMSPKWPSGYWPRAAAPPNPRAWDKSVQSFKADLKAMQELVADPATDLFARIPHGDGQAILREALLLADHNAYHIGQLVLLRKLLGAWKE